MSKFEVGDKVMVTGDERHYGHDIPAGTLAKIEHLSDNGTYGLLATVRTETGVRRKVHAHDLSPFDGHECHWTCDCATQPAEPSVPDCDGNAIRVGRLVEDVSDPCRVRRVASVSPIPSDPVVAFEETLLGMSRFKANGFRVLTAADLHRPPEPDTRDVTLRVVVHDVPNDVVREDASVASDVRSHCDGRWPNQTFTVEVVDDE